MLRRWLLTAVALLSAAAAGAGLTMYWAATRVPDFYEEALAEQPSDPVERREAARQMTEQTTRLVEEIQYSDAWSASFGQNQINSWLAENLGKPQYARHLPPGVSRPRVLIQQEIVHLGFRMQRKNFDGVVSLSVRPQLTAPNRLALEVVEIRAGLIPVPMEQISGPVSKQLQKHGWTSSWQKHEGHDVLEIDLNRGNTEGQPVLEQIELEEGTIHLEGEGGTTMNSWKAALSRLSHSNNGTIIR
ncbi:MAG: hypothetical protein KDA79_04960 [Planctomycetaceae bacterium]|nr:hypothetical protein [Planctomycetaceae bacterium]